MYPGYRLVTELFRMGSGICGHTPLAHIYQVHGALKVSAHGLAVTGPVSDKGLGDRGQGARIVGTGLPFHVN